VAGESLSVFHETLAALPTRYRLSDFFAIVPPQERVKFNAQARC
jgi:hypothetical protein